VLLSIGGNDLQRLAGKDTPAREAALATFRANLTTIVTRLTEGGQTRALLIQTIYDPFGGDPTAVESDAWWIERFNGAIRDVAAAKQGVTTAILDLRTIAPYDWAAIAANVGKVFVSDQVDNAVHVYDMTSNTQTDVIPTTQKGSDSVAYDETDKKVYVANGDSKTLTVIDATNDTVVTQIALPGGPELALWDSFDDTIHQNLAGKNQQAVIDPKTDTVKYLFDLPAVCSPRGAALDPSDQHIIVGCGRQMSVIMDGGDGSILAVTQHVGGSDAVAFNPVDGNYYTASAGFKPGPVLGVLSATTNDWLANASTDTSASAMASTPMRPKKCIGRVK